MNFNISLTLLTHNVLYICSVIKNKNREIMKIISTRQEILDFLIDVEINPKDVLKHEIKNEWLSKELNSMLELLLLDDSYYRNDFNNDLKVLTRNVTNKFN